MRRITVLAIVTVLTLAVLPSVAWGGSPVSPVEPKPPGLDNCPGKYIAVFDNVGYPTCVAWAIIEYNLDIAPRYIAACVLKLEYAWLGDICDEPPPTPTPAPASCDRPGWWRLADWMGRIPLWTDGQRYCVEVER